MHGCVCENRLFVCFNFVAVFHSIFALIHYFILPASQPNKLLILFLTHTHTYKYIHKTYTHIHTHTGTRTSNESCQLAKFKNSHEVRRKQRRVCVSVCVCACVCVPVSVCLCVIYKNLLLLLSFVVLPSLFFFSPVVVECFYSFCVVRTDKQSNSKIERQKERDVRTHA